MNQFYLSYDTSITQSGTTISKMGQYQNPSATNINSFTPALLHATAYPNPAADHIMLHLDHPENGTALLNMYDINGRIVKSLSGEMTQADRFEWMFSIAELSSGFYTAIVRCNDKTWQLKITRE
jgi:hypothetical protein